MTQVAWYLPELDVIVLQTFMEGCSVNFEWGIEDISEHRLTILTDDDLFDHMVLLGEL